MKTNDYNELQCDIRGGIKTFIGHNKLRVVNIWIKGTKRYNVASNLTQKFQMKSKMRKKCFEQEWHVHRLGDMAVYVLPGRK